MHKVIWIGEGEVAVEGAEGFEDGEDEAGDGGDGCRG